MKTDNFNVSIKIFITICIIGLILWILIPESGHYLGASSITYVFLLAVGSDKPILLVLGLSWIVFYIINLVIWFVLAIKCSKPLPFLVVVGVDLFISFLVICYKIFNGNNTDLGHTISGFLFRCSYYCWMISCAKKSVYIT